MKKSSRSPRRSKKRAKTTTIEESDHGTATMGIQDPGNQDGSFFTDQGRRSHRAGGQARRSGLGAGRRAAACSWKPDQDVFQTAALTGAGPPRRDDRVNT